MSEERKTGSVFSFVETAASKVNPRLSAQTSGYRVGLFTEMRTGREEISEEKN